MTGDFEVLGTLLLLHSSKAHANTNAAKQAIVDVFGCVGRNLACHLFVTRSPPWGGLTAVVIVIVTAQIH